MSYATINQSTNDVELRDRIRSAIAKEAWANPDYGATSDGQLVQSAGPDALLGQLIWPCCIDFEADYEYAVESGNEHPGAEDVISDPKVQSAVQVHWPTPPAEAQPEAPTITSLQPATAAVGAAGVQLHVFGTGFAEGAVIVVDDADQATTFVAEGEVTCTMDMPSAPGTLQVVVRLGEAQSAPQAFTVGG